MIGRSTFDKKLALGSHLSKGKLNNTPTVVSADEKGEYEDTEAELTGEVQLIEDGQTKGVIT